MKPIVIMGFRGVGKTTTAGALAEKLRLTVVDTDSILADEAGEPLWLFAENVGERRFRESECSVITELFEKCRSNIVIALGGGFVDFEKSRDTVAQYDATKVFLYTNPEENERRLQSSGEKRAFELKDSCDLRALFAEREPEYKRLADICIDTSALSVDEVCRVILQKVT